MKIKRIRLDSAGSTNDEAKKLLKAGEIAPFLLTADEQTAGKGTHGRSFHSPRGGLYMSLVLPVESVEDSVYFTSLAAVAVCEVLRENEKIDAKIKWINDILLDGKKLVGILCESVFSGNGAGHIVIGVGVNCKKTVFPKELEDIAASYDGSDPVPLSGLIAERITTLVKAGKSEILEKYRALCATVGHTVDFDGRELKAVGIDSDFGLIVTDGKETYIKRNAR